MQRLKLNDGNTIPVLGLGTWKSEPQKVGAAVIYAIEQAGYTHIDGAAIYRNEPEVGEAYAKIFQKIERESIFITSKLWNTEHNPENVEKACKQTLKDLKLDYLDLYLMHWGVAFKPGKDLEPLGDDDKIITEPVSIAQTWKAMESLVKKGLVKSIGVANFTSMMIVDLLTQTSIRPAVNQIELHPYNAQRELVEFCQSKNIVVTAYSPLGRQGVDLPGVRLHQDSEVVSLANRYNKSAAQILIRWAIQRDTVVIPKSVTPERIKENIDVFDFELSEKDLEALNQLERHHRFVEPKEWWGIPYFK